VSAGVAREVDWWGDGEVPETAQQEINAAMQAVEDDCAELAARLAELPEHFVDPDNREVRRFVPAKDSEP
jgi:hypothetical protein